jgi:predicted glutamine amidotransferase
MVWTREFTMCELLAVSTSRPARLTFSLKTLASRGAGSGTMHDGWGVAFYQGNDVALFREPFAAAESMDRSQTLRFRTSATRHKGVWNSPIRSRSYGN